LSTFDMTEANFIAQVKREVSDQLDLLRDEMADDIKALQGRDRMLMGGLALVAGVLVLETRFLTMMVKGMSGLGQQVAAISQALQPAPPMNISPPPAPTVVKQNGYDTPVQEPPATVKQQLADAPNTEVEAPEAL
jgi:hypothetical protein